MNNKFCIQKRGRESILVFLTVVAIMLAACSQKNEVRFVKASSKVTIEQLIMDGKKYEGQSILIYGYLDYLGSSDAGFRYGIFPTKEQFIIQSDLSAVLFETKNSLVPQCIGKFVLADGTYGYAYDTSILREHLHMLVKLHGVFTIPDVPSVEGVLGSEAREILCHRKNDLL